MPFKMAPANADSSLPATPSVQRVTSEYPQAQAEGSTITHEGSTAFAGHLQGKNERLRERLERVESEKDELKSKVQHNEVNTNIRVKAAVADLRRQRDALKEKEAYWENRRLLKQALGIAYQDGLFWRETTNEEPAWKWGIRTRHLIETALGQEETALFLEETGRWVAEPDADKHRKWVDERLNRLIELTRLVDSLRPLKLQPGFDGLEWVSKR